MASPPSNPYAPKSGCPMCSIVTATPHPTPLSSPRTPSFPAGSSSGTTTAAQTQIIWKDENVTAYVEKNNPVSSKGHIIILFNLHVPSLYSLSSTDLPLLVHIQRLAHRLLSQLNPSSAGSSFTPSSNLNPPPSPGPNASPNLPLTGDLAFHVGFITPPFRDSKIPVTDHLHAHAYVGTLDRAGWWRAMAYSSVGWYSIEDLIAEIREQTSNNRVRSTDPERKNSRPIDRVPNAGARAGMPDGRELVDRGLVTDNLDNVEEGAPRPQRRSAENESGPSRRDSHIPLMRVSTPDIVVEREEDSAGRWRGDSKGRDSATPDVPLVTPPSPAGSNTPAIAV
ncbi:Translin [Ceratobasidium sp. AG-Ba]|nr:Translin [Ceratobasidium sp. AG-Ba]QRW14751.1 Translin [Ceratobasidium sp. AG-Ba]